MVICLPVVLEMCYFSRQRLDHGRNPSAKREPMRFNHSHPGTRSGVSRSERMSQLSLCSHHGS